ncbi:hypothetical protein AALP_AA4G014900 [Arabis alpina]|uniref:Retrotransposon gag domain-containing protein n=1 Tax=Arabis alpina TaxID=50452 RepID=A0A087H0G9_ARAAL|nr:hypothetical protein AALP_AA4G014900 [Arabis alpina]
MSFRIRIIFLRAFKEIPRAWPWRPGLPCGPGDPRGQDGGRGPVSESAGNATHGSTFETTTDPLTDQKGQCINMSASESARVCASVRVGGAKAGTRDGAGLARCSGAPAGGVQTLQEGLSAIETASVQPSVSASVRTGGDSVVPGWLPGAGVGPREVASAGAPAGSNDAMSGIGVAEGCGCWGGFVLSADEGTCAEDWFRIFCEWCVAARRVEAELAWADFRAEFNAKFFPQEVADRLVTRFLELDLGERSVRGYDLEFNRLMVYAGRSMEGEEAQDRRFLRGLRPGWRTRCGVSKYATRAKLVETAGGVEEVMRGQAVVVSPAVQFMRPQQQVVPGKAASLCRKRRESGRIHPG